MIEEPSITSDWQLVLDCLRLQNTYISKMTAQISAYFDRTFLPLSTLFSHSHQAHLVFLKTNKNQFIMI